MFALYCRSCRWSLIARFDEEQRADMTTTSRGRQHSTKAAAADPTESAAEQGTKSSVLLLADVIELLFPLGSGCVPALCLLQVDTEEHHRLSSFVPCNHLPACSRQTIC
jgi:hypothetical protein